MRSVSTAVGAAAAIVTLAFGVAPRAGAQLGTVGVGALVSARPAEPVAELHAESPPLPAAARLYGTLSWTDESIAPTIITAAERPMLRVRRAFSGAGVGLLWLEGNAYRPYPMLVSSTVVPLPIPRTSVVAIASALPFQDFDWALVLKIGVTLFFVR